MHTTRFLLFTLLSVLSLTGAASGQQLDFDSVSAFLDHAKDNTALQASGGEVSISRVVAMSGRITQGGKLPGRWDYIQYLQGGSRNWTNPREAFWVSDDVGSQPNRLRVSYVTQQWYDAVDDVLVADRTHPEIRRGYVLRLKGHVRYSAQRRSWSLYPRGSLFSIDEGLEVTGSVGDPLRPFVQSLDYRDHQVSAGQKVRIAGYAFDSDTRVLVGGVEIPVRSVSNDGTKLEAELTSAVPHGYLSLKVSKGSIAGAGEVQLAVNRIPVIASITPTILQADGLFIVEGENLTNVSSSRNHHGSSLAMLSEVHLQTPHVGPTTSVFRLPPNQTPGTYTLVLSNSAGDSVPVTVTVSGGAGIPVLTAAHVSRGGLLVLDGTSLYLPGDTVEVLLADGTALDVITYTSVSVLARLPAGVTQGLASVRVSGRGESNALAFQTPLPSPPSPPSGGIIGALGD